MLPDDKRKKIEFKYNPKDLFIGGYDYSMWSVDKDQSIDKEESEDLPPMPLLEGDEEEVKLEPEETIAERVKINTKKIAGKGLKVLTPSKLLTRLSILLVQIKAGNNSYELKNEIRQRLYLLHQHNKITKKVYNNLIKSL